jgi:hypothetical protein
MKKLKYVKLFENFSENEKGQELYKFIDSLKVEKWIKDVEIIESSMVDRLNPEAKENYKNLFGSKDANPEYKKGYERGYNDGYLDAKGGIKPNNQYIWDKYVPKK